MKITLDSRTLRIDDLEGIDEFMSSGGIEGRGDPYVNDELLDENNDEGEV